MELKSVTDQSNEVFWLHYLRIAACLGVIWLHLIPSAYSDEYSAWFISILKGLAVWPVPVFVMVSGAVNLAPFKTDDITAFYRKRMKRILPPLVFWSFVFLGIRAVDQYRDWGSVDGSSLLHLLLMGRPSTHLWFLFMIPGLYLSAPFLSTLLNHYSERILLAAVGIGFLLISLNDLVQRFWFGAGDLWCIRFIKFIPFFCSGYLFLRGRFVEKIPYWIVWAVLIISFGLGLWGTRFVMSNPEQSRQLVFLSRYSVFMTLTALSIYLVFQKTVIFHRPVGLIRRLSSLTFGIYVIHPLLIRLLREFSCLSDPVRLIFYMIPATLGIFVLSCIAVYGISKIPVLKHTV